jgi:hypothetical protein
MYIWRNSNPIMACAMASRSATQIVPGSLDRPFRAADILNSEFEFSP